MSYMQKENASRVSAIKQKFEINPGQNLAESPRDSDDSDERKEHLRRSVSASPVKIRKSLKLNVSRQLSNPGKNIKRSPAFRCDKSAKTKNLHSPTKEKVTSIVDKNVKLFEDKPEYGKIGNVKKKIRDTSMDRFDILYDDDPSRTLDMAVGLRLNLKTIPSSERGYGKLNRRLLHEHSKNMQLPNTQLSPIKDSVRTTVISRQKNISPIYKTEDEVDAICERLSLDDETMNVTNCESRNLTQLNKFVKNGVEYTRVLKSKGRFNDLDKTIVSNISQSCSENKKEAFMDIREELSRRKNQSSLIHVSHGGAIRKQNMFKDSLDKNHKDDSPKTSFSDIEDESGILSDNLLAALRAPLPKGPPPEKPPRTFAHRPSENVPNVSQPLSFTQKNVNDVKGNLNLSTSTLILNSATAGLPNDSKQIVNSFLNSIKKVTDDELSDEDVTTHPMRSETGSPGNGFSFHTPRRSAENTSSMEPKDTTERIKHGALDSKSYYSDKITVSVKSSQESHPRTSHFPREAKSTEADRRDSASSEEGTSASSSGLPDSTQKLKDSVITTGNIGKSRPGRDSKKMLEKLENVLIQHQKALGPKVIMARTGTKLNSQLDSDSDFESPKRRVPFSERLSRTLEEPRRLGPLPKSPTSGCKKNSTFDCLPSLNCASAGIYEQIKNPDFKTYLPQQKSATLDRPDNYYAKSGDLMANSHFCMESTKNEFYEKLNMSPASRRLSAELSTFLDGKRRRSNPSELEERVYAEPFAFDKNCGVDITGYGKLSPSLRSDILKQDKFKSERQDNELHYMIEQLLDQAFGQLVMAGTETPDSNTSSDTDSLASTLSFNEDFPTFDEKLKLFKERENIPKSTKEELHRSLTEKRKHYVRRVSLRYFERQEIPVTDRRDKLFEVCLLVELNLSTKQPYIKDKYPAYAKVPAWIENFCFPDASCWQPSDCEQNQPYSLVLMDERGNRRYGYCCRVKPEGGPILPLAYCLITRYRAGGFYYKVLHELESRHGFPDRKKKHFIEDLYNSPMPRPGYSLVLKAEEREDDSSARRHSSNNNVITKTITSEEKVIQSVHDSNYVLVNSERSDTEKSLGTVYDIDSKGHVILRSGDHRLEERDMSQLFDAVSTKVLIVLFGSLLLERKVVLLSSSLSKLSSCVEALQSLLYPFVWPHTFIPVLPDIPGLSEILQAPLPFVIGLLKLKGNVGIEVSAVEDGIVVDIDASKIIHAVGDESSILPSRLQKGLKSALQIVSDNTSTTDGVRNFLVSEAFLRVFLETCGHCRSHIVTQQDGKVVFEKESFVKAISSKTMRYFLEWFVETTMFSKFIQDYILRTEGLMTNDEDTIKLFDDRVTECEKAADKSANTKKISCKKKTLGDRLKDLTNFNS
ncbi:uncharacterized protein LOC105694607 isoform X2 [Orussus abietinus]|uniref:uncharacterized protein LOC105694607 isoform X2 n=1 Tax=Orussus abietinus TaxID=222816 RepID=UPI00062675EB|nr:uncharacterized protein LOC105694607 isoform X2 [Orussus abietinus]